MSRIGTAPIILPEGIDLKINGSNVSVKGKLGEISRDFPKTINIKLDDKILSVNRLNNNPDQKALHGLSRSLLNNMVIGVSSGFTKRLELIGTGYRVQQTGKSIRLSIGFSHNVDIEPNGSNKLSVEGQNIIIVTGADKQCVGDQAANIRKLRKPNPYTGKGIKYDNEIIKRKAGKAAATSA